MGYKMHNIKQHQTNLHNKTYRSKTSYVEKRHIWCISIKSINTDLGGFEPPTS